MQKKASFVPKHPAAAGRRAARLARRKHHRPRNAPGSLKPQHKQFVQWLEKAHPRVAKAAAAELARSHVMGDLGADVFEKIADTVQKVAPTLVQASAQKKLLKTQLARAKAGQPPLDASQYAPAMQVNVKPEVPAMSTGTKVALGIGGAVLIGLAVKKLAA